MGEVAVTQKEIFLPELSGSPLQDQLCDGKCKTGLHFRIYRFLLKKN